MTKRILLVDDSKTQRITLRLKLERNGYEIIEAENGMDAMKIVYEQMPDLVLSDIIMPSINGYHLCRLIKRDNLTKHIPVILLTVLDKKIDKFWGLRAGADAFFRKDSPEEELHLMIELLLKQESGTRKTLKLDAPESCDFTAKVAEILDESLVKSTLTNEFRDLAEFVLDENTFNFKLFELLTSILDFNLLGLFYNESDKKDKVLYFTQGEVNVDDKVLTAAKDLIVSKITQRPSLTRQRLRLEYKVFPNNNPYINTEDLPIVTSMEEFNSEVIVPIENEGKIIGLLALFHKEYGKYADLNLLNTIIAELKMVLKIKWLYSETKLLSVIDPLTELYNRRYFQQVLEKEFVRSNRYTSPLSVAMIDIDNFKILNDTYGHQFGDEVLQVISGLFQDSLRKTDYVARYGGEELIAVLPETTIAQAIIPLERLRNKIAENPFVFDLKRIKVTVSIGVAQNTFKYTSTDNFINQADKALYQAKEKGKNRIELAINKE
ncbi:MAG: diguanylate cyclase [bacterium]|nr:diguanylate cyclase [bacterium]